MKMSISRSFVAAALCLSAAWIVVAQPENNKPPSPVIVTNTAANPVPVTGQVNIGSMPAVDARQSGQWDVGITAMPAVRIDPSANTVKVDRTVNFQRADSENWTGQSSEAWTTNSTDRFSKMKVCIAHTGPNPIQVNVFSLVRDDFGGPSFFFTLDRFVIPSPDTVCRLYELPGVSTQVQVLNTGNNTTGLVRSALIGN